MRVTKGVIAALAVGVSAMVLAQAAPSRLAGVALAATGEEASQQIALAAPAPTPWDDAFAAFADADRASPPPEGGVLFVGSSSIRLWKGLERQFGARQVVLKRGFGGSQLSDCVKYLQRLVIRYRPHQVLVYAGDNDLAAGGTPEQVLRRFAAFVDGVQRALPETQIAFISIKPSPRRAALIPKVREANELIRAYIASHSNLAYIDVFSRMLDVEGNPRAELFVADSLHLNAEGYAMWTSIIAPYVQQAAR